MQSYTFIRRTSTPSTFENFIYFNIPIIGMHSINFCAIEFIKNILHNLHNYYFININILTHNSYA